MAETAGSLASERSSSQFLSRIIAIFETIPSDGSRNAAVAHDRPAPRSRWIKRAAAMTYVSLNQRRIAEAV